MNFVNFQFLELQPIFLCYDVRVQPVALLRPVIGSRERDPRTAQIVSSAIEVHRQMGPGLLESAYEECLCHELNLRGVRFERQVPIPLVYKGFPLHCGYQMDLVVEDQVVVELKSVEAILPVHEAQLLTYMKLARKRVGLLINFNVALLKNGIARRVL